MHFSSYDILIHLCGITYMGFEVAVHKMTKRGNQWEGQPYNNRSLILIWAMIGVSVMSGVLFRNILALGNGFDQQWAVTGVGLGLMLVGITIRLIAISTLRQAFSVDLSVHPEHQLITTGIYKKLHHQGYLGGLIAMIGIGVLFLNIWVVCLFVLFNLFAIINRITVEEKMMQEHFKEEWEAYCKNSYRLIYLIY